jgi:hypothetical protein
MRTIYEATGHDHQAKRVSVRSGGAGHAHSGVVKGRITLTENGSVGHASSGDREQSRVLTNTKIVKLGR